MKSVDDFFKNREVTDIALSVSDQANIPLSFAYSILAIESTWATSKAAVEYNNYGGVKKKLTKNGPYKLVQFSHHLDCAKEIVGAIKNSEADGIHDIDTFIKQMTSTNGGKKRAYAPSSENLGYKTLFLGVHKTVQKYLKDETNSDNNSSLARARGREIPKDNEPKKQNYINFNF